MSCACAVSYHAGPVLRAVHTGKPLLSCRLLLQTDTFLQPSHPHPLMPAPPWVSSPVCFYSCPPRASDVRPHVRAARHPGPPQDVPTGGQPGRLPHVPPAHQQGGAEEARGQQGRLQLINMHPMETMDRRHGDLNGGCFFQRSCGAHSDRYTALAHAVSPRCCKACSGGSTRHRWSRSPNARCGHRHRNHVHPSAYLDAAAFISSQPCFSIRARVGR